jgi:S1-C subfamily serine protease
VKDLVEYKEVQRGFTGIDIKDIDGNTAQRLKLNNNHGVIVDYVLPEGPAEQSGIRSGDVVLKINDKDIDSKANFDEQIAYHRPGDKIKVLYLRNGKQESTIITLLNKEGTTAIMKKGTVSSDILGADFQPISKLEKDKTGIQNGYRISNIRQGKIAQMGIQEGFVITAINKKEYQDVNDLIKALESSRGQTSIEGVFANGGRGVFSFYIY